MNSQPTRVVGDGLQGDLVDGEAQFVQSPDRALDAVAVGESEDRLGVQQLPERLVSDPHVFGLGDQLVLQRFRSAQSLRQIHHAHRHVLHHDVEIVLALPPAQRGVHLGGFGVDEPRRKRLAVAGEERVGKRTVTPEDTVPVQLHQQARHRVQQSRAVLGLIRWQPHEQPPVLPRALEVARHQDRGVELRLEHHTRGTHRGQTHLLEPAQDVVLLDGDPRRACP